MVLHYTRACHQRGVLFWSTWIHINWMGIKLYKTCFFSTPRDFNSSTLKIGLGLHKRKGWSSNHHVSGAFAVKFRGCTNLKWCHITDCSFRLPLGSLSFPLEALGPYLPVINEDEVPEDSGLILHSLKLTASLPLKIGRMSEPFSNHPFSGAFASKIHIF